MDITRCVLYSPQNDFGRRIPMANPLDDFDIGPQCDEADDSAYRARIEHEQWEKEQREKKLQAEMDRDAKNAIAFGKTFEKALDMIFKPK
jgi:hypothetical protein